MVDRRIVDRMTIEELEQALLMKRRQMRQERLKQLAAGGRLADQNQSPLLSAEEPPVPKAAAPRAARFQRSQVQPLGAKAKAGPPRPRQRRVRDRLLLAVEIVALIGLVGVLASSFGTLKTLNQEVTLARAASDEAPVQPEPTPLVHFDRLPGGHTPPDPSGAAVPDVPLHLQKWVQPAPAQPVPTPSAAQATRVTIPSIEVDAPVVEGVAWEDLRNGVGHLPGSANPGERGNLYLAGHNDIFGEIFRDLEQVELGDEFFVYSGDQAYRYVVTSKRIIEPSDVSVMYPSTSPIATLQTCYPYMLDTHRLVVIGELAD
jgi:sortase A